MLTVSLVLSCLFAGFVQHKKRVRDIQRMDDCPYLREVLPLQDYRLARTPEGDRALFLWLTSN